MRSDQKRRDDDWGDFWKDLGVTMLVVCSGVAINAVVGRMIGGNSRASIEAGNSQGVSLPVYKDPWR